MSLQTTSKLGLYYTKWPIHALLPHKVAQPNKNLADGTPPVQLKPPEPSVPPQDELKQIQQDLAEYREELGKIRPGTAEREEIAEAINDLLAREKELQKAQTAVPGTEQNDQSLALETLLAGRSETSAEASKLPGFRTMSGWIFVGCKHQNSLLDNNNLFVKLGFHKANQFGQRHQQGDYPVSQLVVTSTPVACRMGAIREMSITLIPQEEGNTVAPYGNSYPTVVPYNGLGTAFEMAEVLRAHVFNFGNAQLPINYIVDPISCVEKKSKKTTARLVG